MTSRPTVSAARRREVIDALRRGTVPQAGLDLFAVGMERFEARHRRRTRRRRGGPGRLQGGPRRVRLGQDVLRPLARRAGQAARHGRRRDPDLRDRDAAAPAGDRLPPPRRAAVHRRLPAERAARDRRCLVLHAGRRRARRRTPSSPDDGRGPRQGQSTRCWSAGSPTSPAPRPRSPRRCAPTGTSTLAGDHGHRGEPDRLDRRPAQRGGLGPPRRRGPGRPGPLRRARLPAGTADDPARLAAIPGFSSCSTRSRPCSGCAPTCATRA